MTEFITNLETFHFVRPFWLAGAVPAVWLWWMLRARTDTIVGWRHVIAPELLAHLVVGGRIGHRLRPVDVLLIAWLVVIFAIAGPTWALKPSPFAADAPPVMILVKVTPSMMNRDLPPTRLVRAQEKISDLLRLEPTQAAGLIAYAGSAHLVLPPTHDTSVVVQMGQALAPDEMPQTGNDLAGALALASQVLSEGANGGSILVIADDLPRTSGSAFRKGQRVAVPITILATTAPGRRVGAAIRQVASQMGAIVVAVTADTADIVSIGRRLDRLRNTAQASNGSRQWQDTGWYLTPIIAVLMLLWFRRGWVVQA